MDDWRAKQRALRMYEYDAPERPGRRKPRGGDSSMHAPAHPSGGGGLQGGAAVAVPTTTRERNCKAR